MLDLATGQETPLAETRSIDDQLAWLDDEHLLYGDERRRPGSSTPTARAARSVWLAGADSPTVQGAATAAP